LSEFDHHKESLSASLCVSLKLSYDHNKFILFIALSIDVLNSLNSYSENHSFLSKLENSFSLKSVNAHSNLFENTSSKNSVTLLFLFFNHSSIFNLTSFIFIISLFSFLSSSSLKSSFSTMLFNEILIFSEVSEFVFINSIKISLWSEVQF